MTQFDYTEAIAVVTGAASGIGRALAEALVNRGARVYGVDIVDFAPEHSNMSPLTCDVSDRAEYAALLARIESDEKRIDFLANVAGLDHPLSATMATVLT